MLTETRRSSCCLVVGEGLSAAARLAPVPDSGCPVSPGHGQCCEPAVVSAGGAPPLQGLSGVPGDLGGWAHCAAVATVVFRLIEGKHILCLPLGSWEAG